tara:strand:- start:1181 stop:1444 length:264 start_codon:yes stop_codon:yes gene_type:complete
MQILLPRRTVRGSHRPVRVHWKPRIRALEVFADVAEGLFALERVRREELQGVQAQVHLTVHSFETTSLVLLLVKSEGSIERVYQGVV